MLLWCTLYRNDNRKLVSSKTEATFFKLFIIKRNRDFAHFLYVYYDHPITTMLY